MAEERVEVADEAPSAPETTRRQDLEAAIETLSAPVAESTEAVPAPEGQRQPAARDPLTGRFKPDEGALPKYLDAQAQRSTPREQPQALRAPQSWSPAARQKWDNLPPDLREIIHKREAEVVSVLDSSATDRQIAEAFRREAAPYAMLLHMEGSDPARAFGQYLRTVATLRTGTDDERADLFGNLITQYGVDVGRLVANLITRHGADVNKLDRDLAQRLHGGGQARAPAGSPQASQGYPQGNQFQDPRVDQLLAALNQTQVNQQQALAAEAQASVQQFAPEAEFFEDLRASMADVLEMAAHQGKQMSLEDAYWVAAQMHPEIRQIYIGRAQAANGGAQVAAARRAGSSVAGGPSAPPGTVALEGGRGKGRGGDRREDIMAAIASLSNR